MLPGMKPLSATESNYTAPHDPMRGMPEQKPDGAPHNGASSGDCLCDGLGPSVAVPGGTPMSLGGFSATPERDPMPRDPMTGYTQPPTGSRR